MRAAFSSIKFRLRGFPVGMYVSLFSGMILWGVECKMDCVSDIEFRVRVFISIWNAVSTSCRPRRLVSAFLTRHWFKHCFVHIYGLLSYLACTFVMQTIKSSLALMNGNKKWDFWEYLKRNGFSVVYHNNDSLDSKDNACVGVTSHGEMSSRLGHQHRASHPDYGHLSYHGIVCHTCIFLVLHAFILPS
jgi:hypothetical protein